MEGSDEGGGWSQHDLRRGVTRRDFLAAGLGTLMGAAAVGIGWSLSTGSTSPPPTTTTTVPLADAGRGTGVVTDLRHATDVLDAGPIAPVLDATAFGRPWYPPGSEESVAVVAFDASDPALSAAYLDPEVAPEPDYAVVDGRALVALILRDPHLGCRNVFCESSGWWENPCHHEKYNLIGEWQSGESMRGLDRYPARVEDGRLLVVLRRTVMGPARDAGAGSSEPSGPHCIGP